MNPLTDAEILAIKERCAKATAGPIGIERTKECNYIGPMRASGVKVASIIFNNDRNYLREDVLRQRDADADHLVMAWNSIPKLLAEVERLKADAARLDWLEEQELRQWERAFTEEGRANMAVEYLVLAEDGTTCWGATYRQAIDAAIKATPC